MTELPLLSDRFANVSSILIQLRYFVTIQIHVFQFSQRWGPIFSQYQPHTQGIFPNSIGR